MFVCFVTIILLVIYQVVPVCGECRSMARWWSDRTALAPCCCASPPWNTGSTLPMSSFCARRSVAGIQSSSLYSKQSATVSPNLIIVVVVVVTLLTHSPCLFLDSSSSNVPSGSWTSRNLRFWLGRSGRVLWWLVSELSTMSASSKAFCSITKSHRLKSSNYFSFSVSLNFTLWW